ncbi:MAG: hypothetical protein DWH91_05280 [Planctomycetota bacterium]|nr:MAG: hypothetical protein DWH91_05280 [Planctomycetota bacterium]
MFSNWFERFVELANQSRGRRRPGSLTITSALESRVLLSGDHGGYAGVDVAYGVFTPEEFNALESVPVNSALSTKTAIPQADGGHQPNTLTIVLDFKETTQADTTDIFGNVVSAFDVTSFGFAAADFDLVVSAILAEVDEDYFTELLGTVAGPAGQDLAIDFMIGDIGVAPVGVTNFYYVQIGTGVAGPHTGGGILGVAGGGVVRNSSGVGPNFGIAPGDVVSSVFTDIIQGLGGLAPGNALTSGNQTFTRYAVAGTLSHEIGHTLSLSHINWAGSVQPVPGAAPIMGTGAIDLPNQQRISDRMFSLSGVDGENGDAPRQHVQQLVNAVGLHNDNSINDPPTLDDQVLPAVRENSPVGTVVGTVIATDPNSLQTLSYSIVGGNTSGAFSIDSATGVVRVANPTAVNWEINPVFNLTVQALDTGSPARSDTGIVTIAVQDVTTFILNSGILTIRGTHFEDQLTVRNVSGKIQIIEGANLIDTQILMASVTAIQLHGLASNDKLRLDTSLGAAISGAVFGGSGNDVLLGTLGTDLLDGGSEIDEVSYLQATTGVTVSLLIAGPQNTVGAGLDTLVSIENLSGSQWGDVLTGNDFDNALSGQGGNDIIHGRGGADRLDGGAGDDTLLGGEGNDTIVFDLSDSNVSGDGGIDSAILVNPTAAVNIVLASKLIEGIDASSSRFNNILDARGMTSAVTIIGGSGNDTIYGGNNNDQLNGGQGHDTLIGNGGSDRYDAGHGDDRIDVDSLDSVVLGGAGRDTVNVLAGSGSVNLNLGAGQIEVVNATQSTQANSFNASTATWNVVINGGSGSDTIIGGSAVDTLNGNGGNDTIRGNAGNDIMDGGAGSDVLEGGGGNDLLYFDNLDTVVNGGADADTARVKGATGAVNVNLRTGLLEMVNAETSAYHNRFDASGATWIVNIIGGRGNDTILGGDNNDRLFGGSGNDTVTGNRGNDYMNGGLGIDTISYSTATGSVNVNLATGRATGAAGTDTFIGFENVTGSIYVDRLTGTTGNNTIIGGGGLDIISGGGGRDTIVR